MVNIEEKLPVVLVIAGHDPTGAAGIQADIESIAANHCQSVSLITCLTVQNTGRFSAARTTEPELFRQQADCLLQDVTIDACKIGLINNTKISEITVEILSRLNVPVVLDPVIKSGTGQLISNDTIGQLYKLLLPLVTVLTPNIEEAQILGNNDDLSIAAKNILNAGCKSVLITGTHDNTDPVTNRFYYPQHPLQTYNYEKLPGSFHGSGCTLSAALAAALACGNSLEQSVKMAQEYTWETLSHAVAVGKSQKHPSRFFKSR